MKRAIYILSVLLLACSTGAFAGNTLHLSTIAIDAGHGGKDPGAVSKDKKTYEKTLTADITSRLCEKIKESFPDVKVITTRSGDRFVSLDERAAAANKSGAQLFISIHINSCKSDSPSGYSIHTLGQSRSKNRDLFAYNLDVCRRENAVVLLEDDYSTKYQGFDPSDPESYIFMQFMQNAHLEQSLVFAQDIYDALGEGPIKSGRGIWQDPFYVLWKTAMPAVLVELGFISNSSDLAVLRSESGREKITEQLYKAFCTYKKKYDASVELENPAPEPAAKPSGSETPAPAVSGDRYGTQIFVLTTRLEPNDPRFLGMNVEIIENGGCFKYVIGVCENKSDAIANLLKARQTYKDAFLVHIPDAGVASTSATK